MAPPLFADVSKTANDLFVKDHKDFNGKLEVTNALSNGVNLKTIFTRSEATGAITSVVEAKKKLGSTDCTLKYNSDNQLTVVGENSSLVPNLKLKAEQALTASAPALTAEYKAASVAGSATLDVVKQTASLSAVTSTAGVLLGISSTYNSAKGSFSGNQLKGHYTGPNYEVGASVEDGSKIGLTFYQNLRSDLALAVSLNKAKDVSLAVGGAYTCCKASSLRGKLESNGTLSALYTHKLRPEVTLKALGQLNVLQIGKAPRVGVNVVVNV